MNETQRDQLSSDYGDDVLDYAESKTDGTYQEIVRYLEEHWIGQYDDLDDYGREQVNKLRLPDVGFIKDHINYESFAIEQQSLGLVYFLDNSGTIIAFKP